MTATPPPAAPAAPLSDSDARLWASLAHFGGIIFGFLAPLIIWLVYRERSTFVEGEAKEALNFQITALIGYVASAILTAITFGLLSPIGFLVWVAATIFSIIGGIAANKGTAYRYPFALRLVK